MIFPDECDSNPLTAEEKARGARCEAARTVRTASCNKCAIPHARVLPARVSNT